MNEESRPQAAPQANDTAAESNKQTGRLRAQQPDLRLEIATGGRPVEALLGALSRIEHRPGLASVGVHHDDHCRSLESGSMRDCSCEIVGLTIRRLAPRQAA